MRDAEELLLTAILAVPEHLVDSFLPVLAHEAE
jgi:hypothetical protein